MIESCDVAVVGAGPAGLAAAAAAARTGARVVLVDDNSALGGQYFRQPPAAFARSSGSFLDKDRQRLDHLLEQLAAGSVDHRPSATVWDVPEPRTLAVAAGVRSGRVAAKAVVLATGARDRAVPFPGWTRPGVMSAGGVLNLLKGMRVVPPGPALVAGTGPLLLVVAASLVRAGVEVSAVVEAGRPGRRAARHALALAVAPAIVKLAADYRLTLMRAGTRLFEGRVVVDADGGDEIETATIAPIDAAGRIGEARERFVVRTLVTGFGLVPSGELGDLLGLVRTPAAAATRGTLARDRRLMTSAEGVFAAGDGVRIGGVEMALVEGRIAGLEAACHAGAPRSPAITGELARLRLTRARLDVFRAALDRVFPPPSSWLGLLRPDTNLCRCEDVRLADVERLRAEGAVSATQLKAALRVGMGRCQGRNCAETLAALLAHRDGRPISAVEMPRARPPARPIPLGDLLTEDLPPPALPDDPHLPRRG